MVKQNNDLKKNKQDQPEKKSVSIFKILIFIKYCGFESNLIAEKGKYIKKHLPYWLKYTKYILTLVTLHNNLVYRIPLDSKI